MLFDYLTHDVQLQRAKGRRVDEKTDNICDSVLQLGLYTTQYAVHEFFTICSLDIEHTEEKLREIKKKQFEVAA